ncbi:MAG: hypothetical protein Unbinned1606contig1000_44 [Prokaryotic dsDNA virus sp.]|nr:MAG: hypothetical protein Unbinned1606contig1000_44 [Prokaryotic dsDNA virus sp.]|tara:strand:+ start:22839 stop:23999 length:1161 start_codon:yes stop_codon:yes gene_type:complete
MPSTPITTFNDVVDHLLDHMGGVEEGRNVKMARRSVMSAYRGLPSVYNWSYYYKRGRINTVAAYSTGTVTYDHTGGTYEKQLTLSGGTWPSWAGRGMVTISSIDYQVASRKSDTVLTLKTSSNPGEDVAAGTSYSIGQDTYVLPVDFQSADEFRNASQNWDFPEYVSPGEWMELHRSNESSNQPRAYTILADPDYVGAMAVSFHPAPSSADSIDFMYQRVPSPVRTMEYKTGQVVGQAGGTTVTGTDTKFTSKMVGSVLRFGTVKNLPDGVEGLYPYEEERIITSVESDTSLTVDAVLSSAHSQVKYRISDIIDIEPGAMLEAFLSYCELRMSILMKDSDTGEKQDLYAGALRLAMQADSRNYGSGKTQGGSGVSHLRDNATITIT